VIGHGSPYSNYATVEANQQVLIGTIKEETPYMVILKNGGYTGIVTIYYIRNSLVAKRCLLEYDEGQVLDSIICPTYNSTTANIYFKPSEKRNGVYYKVIEL